MQIVKQFTIHVTPRIRETLPNGAGYRWVDGPATKEEVTVEVDFTGIANSLGQKAAHSKGGTSKECSGLVIVRHLRRKRKAA